VFKACNFIPRSKGDKLAYRQSICSQEDKISRQFDYLDDLEAFLAVADHGSFTAGAVALSTTPSVLSRAVTRLENRLGGQLLRRSTRQVKLTEAGSQYLEQARAAFTLLGDAEREIQGQADALKGRVRMSVPTTYGHHRLPPLLARFARQYPQVRVELNITNRNVDLVAEGFDLTIRLGHMPDSGLVARKLADEPLCLVASPDYLGRAGTPRTLEALQAHACLPFILPRTGRIAPWVFRDGGQDIEWTAPSTIEVSDDVLGVVSLAVAGIGIAQSYDFIVAGHLESGRLVELLPQLRGRSRPFSVVYAPHRRQSAATRAMIDILTGAGRPGPAP
jgi:DNA-binding transcriptional LysR family regulator